jgi:hypothetical protein
LKETIGLLDLSKVNAWLVMGKVMKAVLVARANTGNKSRNPGRPGPFLTELTEWTEYTQNKAQGFRQTETKTNGGNLTTENAESKRPDLFGQNSPSAAEFRI